ncbi:hypothetical protein LEP1GSC162_2862 [Leptospira santarosai str. CBC1531]|nr:hypothetical protein LEP1GSC162_2862 [Leptospira santarosai str. CBC1531]
MNPEIKNWNLIYYKITTSFSVICFLSDILGKKGGRWFLKNASICEIMTGYAVCKNGGETEGLEEVSF